MNAVLGHRGMVGSAIIRALAPEPIYLRNGDLTEQNHTKIAVGMREAGVSTIYLCAAKVGGIQANLDQPVEFLRTNLLIALNVCEMTHQIGAKLVFLGSSCIYPRDCEQPIKESALLTGPFEPSNEGYAFAKVAGIKLCEAYAKQYGLKYLALMPCNLYGPGDNYDARSSHVLPALIRKFHEAKVSGAGDVTIWGTGTPRREFLHVDDCAAAAVHLVRSGAEGLVNIGAGADQTIRELAELVALVVGFSGNLIFDPTKPDGTPRKLLDVTRLKASGWNQRRSLAEGIGQVYQDYVKTV